MIQVLFSLRQPSRRVSGHVSGKEGLSPQNRVFACSGGKRHSALSAKIRLNGGPSIFASESFLEGNPSFLESEPESERKFLAGEFDSVLTKGRENSSLFKDEDGGGNDGRPDAVLVAFRRLRDVGGLEYLAG